jgi:hypothetical protein
MLRSGSVSNDQLAETGIRKTMVGYVRSVRICEDYWLGRVIVFMGEVVMGRL